MEARKESKQKPSQSGIFKESKSNFNYLDSRIALAQNDEFVKKAKNHLSNALDISFKNNVLLFEGSFYRIQGIYSALTHTGRICRATGKNGHNSECSLSHVVNNHGNELVISQECAEHILKKLFDMRLITEAEKNAGFKPVADVSHSSPGLSFKKD